MSVSLAKTATTPKVQLCKVLDSANRPLDPSASYWIYFDGSFHGLVSGASAAQMIRGGSTATFDLCLI